MFKLLVQAGLDKDRCKKFISLLLLIDKKGLCTEYAVTACSLAKALSLKAVISGTGDHMVYCIRVNGTAYIGSNQVLNLDFPTPDSVHFQQLTLNSSEEIPMSFLFLYFVILFQTQKLGALKLICKYCFIYRWVV